jgi:hypothetical protein
MNKNNIREMWPIEKLKEWDKNPRTITAENLERLKKQIQKFGQYKPLVINEDGIVLGGNMRLRALRELEIQEVWVSIVKPADLNEMLEYSLSDNDRAGKYDEFLLRELLPEFDVDLSEWTVDLTDPVVMTDVFTDSERTYQDKNKEINADEVAATLNTTCPRCGFEFTNDNT